MWRFTAEPVRILVIDARALAPLGLWAVHMRWWTFYVAIGASVAFGVLAFFGLTIPVAFRMLRVLVCGPVRPRLPAHKRRHYA